MVIDDEHSILGATRELLETWGCAVVTTTDQEEALNHLSQMSRPLSAVIADYRLHINRTGIEAIRAIQKVMGQEITSLIVTGDNAVEQLREVSSRGYTVLHKPVATVKLRAFLRNKLANQEEPTS